MQTQTRWPEADLLDTATLPEVARVVMHLALELAKETEGVSRRSVEEAAEAVEHAVGVVDAESRDHDSFAY